MPHCSKLAKDAIAELAQEGIAATFEEQCWINELGLAVEEPCGAVDAALFGSPVKCRNVTLYPFTAASFTWYYNTALPHYESDSGASLALAFALSHGIKPEVLEELIDRASILQAVNRWAMRLTASLAQVKAAAYRVAPGYTAPHALDEPDPDSKPAEFKRLIAELVAGTGLDERYWKSRPISTLQMHLQAVYSQAAVGMMSADEQAEYRRNNLNFMKAVEAIRRSRKAA